MVYKNQIVFEGNILNIGEQWKHEGGNRISLTFPMRIGARLSIFDSRRGRMFNGVVDRADSQGVEGDTIPAGTPVRVISKKSLELADAKSEKVRLVDARTTELIDDGFQFPPGTGQRFSLSSQAQSNLLGAFVSRNEPEFEFPFEWNNIDDTDVFEIANAGVMRLFYLTAVGTVKAHKGSGTRLKKQINKCKTVAEVDAVVDDR